MPRRELPDAFVKAVGIIADEKAFHAGAIDQQLPMMTQTDIRLVEFVG